MFWRAFIIAVLFVGVPTAAKAGESDALLPDIPRGKGESCVADSDFMRLNHMDLLLHERDETVHEGERDTKYSLKKCIACHAVDGPDGQPVKASSPQHFCRACHDYAAVSIDCFQCHASRPEPKVAKSGKSGGAGGATDALATTGIKWTRDTEDIGDSEK